MSQAVDRLQTAVERLMAGRSGVRVLEAGCGRKSSLSMHADWRIVGIDIAEHQLAGNPHLHERIQGDLQTYVWPRDSFDLIVCWDVLEHLSEPRRALNSLADALKPGGVLVVAVPNLYSVKGLVTKYTPFAVHAWFYRHLIGDKRDQSECDQFPTFFRSEIAPRRLKTFAHSRELDVVYCDVYEGPVQTHLRRHHPLANVTLAVLGGVSRVVSGGHGDLNLTDCIIVLQRNRA